MASWSSSNPTSKTYGSAVESGNVSLSQGHALFTAAIARGDNDTIYVKVDFKRAAYDGYQYISISMTAEIGGKSVTATGTWGKYSTTYTTFATRYYTGTAAANANVTVTATISGTSRSVTLKAPAYTSSYTITYNGNGNNSGSTAPQPATYGAAKTVSSNGYTKSGYTFVKWNTSANGGGTDYYPGGSITVYGNVTLYAIWSQITYPVTYNGNGADGGATAAQTKKWGTPLSLSANGFTRTNYTFLYWNTAADGSGTRYNAGASYTTNASLTLYAIWKKNNIPVFVRDGNNIIQVEKAFMRVGNNIVECTVYQRIGNDIIVYQ